MKDGALMRSFFEKGKIRELFAKNVDQFGVETDI